MDLANEIGFGIITAPRDLPTLEYSINSLRKYIPKCYLNIFAEPGRLEVSAYKMNILVNNERLGALNNYHNALTWILKYSKKPYIFITEDDYVYNSTIVNRLEDALNYEGEFGYFNMFTNYWNPSLPNPMPEGWNELDLGYYTAWGMAYLMRTETAKKLVENPTYLNYLNTTKTSIDGAISESFKQMDLKMFYHNPSPTCTCGIISTLGHECKTDGLHFRLKG